MAKSASKTNTKTIKGNGITLTLDRSKYDEEKDYDDQSPLKNCPAIVTSDDGRQMTWWRAVEDGRWKDGEFISRTNQLWLLKQRVEQWLEKGR